MTPNEQKPESQSTPEPQPVQPVNTPPAPASPPAAEPAEPFAPEPSPQPAPPSALGQPAKHFTPFSGPLILTIAVAAVVFVLIAVGAVYAYQHPKKKPATAPTITQVHSNLAAPEGTGPSNCLPVKATSLSKSSAETVYQSFVKAVVAQNQTCADDQSSSFFLDQAKEEFGAADGKWITASPQGIRPIWKDLSQLPTTLSDSSFTQTSYTRPIVLGQSSSNSTEHPQGMELSYPVDLSKYTGSTSEKWQVSISFVLQSGTIQVDDLVVEPQQ